MLELKNCFDIEASNVAFERDDLRINFQIRPEQLDVL